MKVYQTDHEGFFVGAVEADPDPLDGGNWIIPGGCVTAEPPALTEGQRAQWTGSAWAVVDPVPEPKPEPTLEEIRANTRIPRPKFALAAFKADLITEQDMEGWAGGTSIPAWVADTIDGAIAAGHIPAEQRPEVRIAVLTQDTIGRMDRLIPILAERAKLSPEQVDALFGIE